MYCIFYWVFFILTYSPFSQLIITSSEMPTSPPTLYHFKTYIPVETGMQNLSRPILSRGNAVAVTACAQLASPGQTLIVQKLQGTKRQMQTEGRKRGSMRKMKMGLIQEKNISQVYMSMGRAGSEGLAEGQVRKTKNLDTVLQ